jgi:hypothetical protein
MEEWNWRLWSSNDAEALNFKFSLQKIDLYNNGIGSKAFNSLIKHLKAAGIGTTRILAFVSVYLLIIGEQSRAALKLQ